MGGHGGLNILPQKKWNVYNRDNRLKVARDEAKYDQRQQVIAEKHNAAEREHRRLALKERARQRHGGAASINLDALEAGEGSRSLEIEVTALTTRYQCEEGAPPPDDGAVGGDPMLSLGTTAAGASSLPPPLKRQKREEVKEKRVSKKQKHAPSLAEIARQLDSAPQLKAAGVSQIEKANITETSNTAKAAAPKLEHFNLFAEEESRAKNPDKAAEQRLLLSKRGDMKTHTSNPLFDESFQFGYGLGGGGGGGGGGVSAREGSHSKSPWYARHPSSLTAVVAGADGNSSVPNGHQQGAALVSVPVMEKWKEEGRAALIAAERDSKKGEGISLLKGVKVIPKAAENEHKKGKKRKIKGEE